MIGASAAHVLLSVAPFAIAGAAAMIGPHWAGAAGVALYWAGRELAQSMRPSAPLRFVWTWSNTRNLAQPVAAALTAAALIDALL